MKKVFLSLLLLLCLFNSSHAGRVSDYTEHTTFDGTEWFFVLLNTETDSRKGQLENILGVNLFPIFENSGTVSNSGVDYSVKSLTIPQSATAQGMFFYEASGDGTNKHTITAQTMSADRQSYWPDYIIGFLSSTQVDSGGELADGSVDFVHLAADAKFLSLAVVDLSDTSTPSVLTTAETTNKCISNYKATGADHVFTMPAAHAAGNVIFQIGDEFQVDIEPATGTAFYLNGTAMANDEHIQNTADTIGQRIVGYCVNINGALTWMFYSSDSAWVEETP